MPLKPKSRLLVIGPLADATRVLRGNCSSPLTGGPVSVLAGLQRAFPKSSLRHLPSPPSITDGDPVPVQELQTTEGQPGLEFKYLNAKGAQPRSFVSLVERARYLQTVEYAEMPTLTHIEPHVTVRAPTLSKVSDY